MSSMKFSVSKLCAITCPVCCTAWFADTRPRIAHSSKACWKRLRPRGCAIRLTNRRRAPICIGQEIATEDRRSFAELTGRSRTSELLDTRGPEQEYAERQYLSVASLL